MQRVEVSPSLLRRGAFASGYTETVGASELTSPMLEQNPHVVFSQIKVNPVDHPRVIETDQVTIMLLEIRHSDRVQNPKKTGGGGETQ
jgi:hypothetical protein